VPKKLMEYMKDGSEAQKVAVTKAMFTMKKLDIAAFTNAYDAAK
jgi:predicted 3-demethylubiquinone-9 3-methyltransferase (glyoxalase superfamily)